MAFALCLLIACSSPKQRPTPAPAQTTVAHATVSPEPRSPAPTTTPASTPAPPALRELFPHIRADIAAKLVEFDGTVPMDCHDPVTPLVYLEVVACTTDTKEHESLVVTSAKPSHIHAALLAIGLQPGSPGSWKWENKKLSASPPTGDALDIRVAFRNADGKEIEAPITSWIVNVAPGAARFGSTPGSRFVFAGSGIVKRRDREMYDADGSGLLIGLTTFGSETIAWSEVISHEAMINEPEWIADAKVVPKFGTPVIVRIRPAR